MFEKLDIYLLYISIHLLFFSLSLSIYLPQPLKYIFTSQMYIITIRIIFFLLRLDIYIYSSLIERNKEQVFRKERKGETIEVRKKFFPSSLPRFY